MHPNEDQNRRLLRARDAMDRDFAEPLDVPGLARVAMMSPAHFSRQFRATFAETPHRYLQRRRIERACALLRDTELSVTDISFAVGFESLGTFSRTFTAIIGRSPSAYRAQATPLTAPVCFVKGWTRPSSADKAGVPDRAGSADRAVSDKHPVLPTS
ncbi:helix-turn-helix domain-containing protein [Pseudactinotalea sp. Z1739]|uniref:helix-turn-helix domain-containing protein n=1 Tax=Pseudactinotalea sp. Z1739 TaxID=3413028 RepID=UPI003C7E16CB